MFWLREVVFRILTGVRENVAFLWHTLGVPFQDGYEDGFALLDDPPRLISYLYGADRRGFARSYDIYSSWTLMAPDNGLIRVRLGRGRWEELRLGSWVVCPPQLEFAREAIQTPFSYHFARFDWFLNPEVTARIKGRHTTQHLDRLSQDLDDWRALEGFPSQGAHLWREHLLWDVLGLGWCEQRRRVRKPASDAAMLKARALIEKNAVAGISLADIAARLQLSPVALTRQFRAAFGVTPSQFLQGRRLERARQLLISTDWPLDTIATQCGLGNGFYLSRVWSKQFGQSPSRFRRENQI